MKNLARALLVSVAALILMSSAAVAYLYRAPVAITENSSTSYTMLPVLWNSPNTWLNSNGFFGTGVNTTRVQTLGGLNKPWMVADNKTLTAIPVPADSQTNLYFTTGETAASAMDIIFGNGGYATTIDDPALELGSNGTISLTDIYLPSSGTANLTRKDNALRIAYNAAAENVTAYTPTRASDNLVSSNDTETSNTAAAYTLLSTIVATSTIDNARIKFDMRTNWAGVTAYGKIYKNGVAVGTEQSTIDVAYNTYSEDLFINAVTGDSIQLYGYTADPGVRQVFVRNFRIYFDAAVTVTVGSVPSGEYSSVNFTISGGSAILGVSGVSETTEAMPLAILDGANNWIWLEGIPYAASITLSVNATNQLRYEPNTIVQGTTLPDRAGTKNGDITWGSNPAGVGVTLGSMVSSSQSSALEAEATSTSDLLPVAGGRNWRPDASVSAALLANPMRPIVTAISDNTTLSEYQVWVWFGIILVAFITVLVGSRVRGHHLITGIAVSAAIALLVVWTVFPIWSIAFIVVAILAGAISERSPTL